VERIQAWFEPLRSFLEYPLIRLGNAQLSLRTVIYVSILLVFLFWFAGRLRRLLADRVLAKAGMEPGARQAVGSIVRYAVLIVGFLVALQTAGIDLTTLNVIAGAVGIGVGFGLQNVANNFISGLIILFERPIKVGDRIEVGNVDGDVIEIGARSTTVLTNDNIAILVPNSKLITENVVNWKYTDARVRFRIPVGVAYGSDVRRVEELLREVARENPDVLDTPPPQVWFRGFGDSSLNFELLVWNISLVHSNGQFISALNFAIFEKFKQHRIEIPFPQRDLRLRGDWRELSQLNSGEARMKRPAPVEST
jgi:small-conductance mechanosensitive channel